MVELVDTRDLKSREPCARAGSTPALGTSNEARITLMEGNPGFFYAVCLPLHEWFVPWRKMARFPEPQEEEQQVAHPRLAVKRRYRYQTAMATMAPVSNRSHNAMIFPP